MAALDYPPYLVGILLEYSDEIESIKCKITPTLVANAYPINKDEGFYEKPGNTLRNRGSMTTRVPHNSNARIEALCDLTCDVAQARKAVLTPAQDIALMAVYSGLDVSDYVKGEASKAFDLVVAYLNRC